MSTWGPSGLAERPATWPLEQGARRRPGAGPRTPRRIRGRSGGSAWRLGSARSPPRGAVSLAEQKDGRTSRQRRRIRCTGSSLCHQGAPAARSSTPSAVSILATVGVQDGLLAVPRVRLTKQVGHDQPVFGLRAFDTPLLTLMKGDEIIEGSKERGHYLLLFARFGNRNNEWLNMFVVNLRNC